MQRLKLFVALFLMAKPTFAYVTANSISMEVGDAYDSLTASLKSNHCVSGERTVTHGASKAQLISTRNASHTELAKSLGVKVGVSVRVHPLIRVSGSVDYISNTASSTLDETYSLQAEVRKQIKELRGLTINEEFANKWLEPAALTQSSNLRPELVELCGDSYIDTISEGIRIHATMSVHFANQSMHKEWKGKVGLTVAEIFEVAELDLSKLSGELRESTRITISMLQQGGSPEQILRVVPVGGILASMGMISCSIAKISECQRIYQTLLSYIKNLPHDQQQNNLDLYPLAYTSKKYVDAMFLSEFERSNLRPQHRRFIEELRESQYGFSSNADVKEMEISKSTIEDALGTQREYLTMAARMRSRNADGTTQNTSDIYEEHWEAIKANVEQLEVALALCIDRPKICSAHSKPILANLRPIRGELLYSSATTFAEWCDQYQLNIGDGEDRQTVHAILLFAAGTSQVNTLNCKEVVPVVESYSYIKIARGSNISSLRPFASLSNLRWLDVSGQMIEDLSNLQDMRGITQINLADNLIESIESLKYASPSLRILNLDRNQIAGELILPKMEVPLRELYLQKNRIRKLDARRMADTHIYLADNQELEVSGGLLVHLHQIDFTFDTNIK